MKRKNLILSLVCSIVLAIGLITFTIVSLIPNNQNSGDDVKKPVSDITDPDLSKDINEGNDGSEEKPYIIADAKMFNDVFVEKYVDENGNYINYNEIDEKGDLVHPELNAGLNFKLSNDIDFAESLFVTIFNKGIAFNGTIDGAGFALKNITIEVTKENLASFMYDDDANNLGYRAHIGIFGKLDGAKITNLKVSGITLKVDQSVLEYLTADDTTFVADYKDVMYEISAGLIAGLAFDSEINVEVEGTVDASLCVPSSSESVGTNALGGLVGAAVDTDLSNSKSKVAITLNGDGSKYFVGGIAGKAYSVKANNVIAETAISADCDNKVYVGGAFGLVQGLEADGVNIIVDINELNERKSDETVADMSSSKADDKINVAGFVAVIDARYASKLVVIKNAKVDADVQIDGVYAGAFLDVKSNSDKTVKIITIENIEISSDINVLKAFGLARLIKNAEIKTKLALGKVGIDFALTGEVRLKGEEADSLELIYLSIDDLASTFGENRQYSLTISISDSIRNELDINDSVVANSLKDQGRLKIVEEKVVINFETEEDTKNEVEDKENNDEVA